MIRRAVDAHRLTEAPTLAEILAAEQETYELLGAR